MSFIRSSLYNIINKYKTEELPNQLKSIENDRSEINTKIKNILTSDSSILNKFYLNKLNHQIGGAKFDENTVKKLDELNEMFTKLESIDPSQISANNIKIKEKTDEILKLIQSISSKPDIDLKDMMYKMPLQLDSTLVKLKQFDKAASIEVYPQLAKLYAPIDTLTISKLENSTELANKLKFFEERFNKIKANPSSTSIEQDLNAIKEEIEQKITELNKTTDEIIVINQTLTEKIKSFNEDIRPKPIEKNKLKLVESESEFIKKFKSYCDDNKANLDKDLKSVFDKYIHQMLPREFLWIG